MRRTRNSRSARLRFAALATALALGAALGACSPGAPSAPSPGTSGDEADPQDGAASPAPLPSGELVSASPDDLRLGVAVAGGGHHLETGLGSGTALADETYASLVAENFTSLSPENQLKWEWLRPERETFDFAAADELVAFAQEHGLAVRGHTLFWHSQNPAWLTSGELDDDELREVLREHVETVVGRYAGQIEQWDVANEIFDDQARLRTQDNPFLGRFGVEIVADVFRWAHEADPEAVLFLNDYAIESIGPKSDAYFELVQELLADGVPVHGMGFQGHLSMKYPKPGDMRENLERFAELGLEVAVTEADVRMAVEDGVASPEDLAAQAGYYEVMLDACLEVDSCRSFTVWGLSDAFSWVPFFFAGEGAATLLDEEYRVKPAYVALVDRLATGR